MLHKEVLFPLAFIPRTSLLRFLVLLEMRERFAIDSVRLLAEEKKKGQGEVIHTIFEVDTIGRQVMIIKNFRHI